MLLELWMKPFYFSHGFMSITLRDVVVIFGLPIHDSEISNKAKPEGDVRTFKEIV